MAGTVEPLPLPVSEPQIADTQRPFLFLRVELRLVPDVDQVAGGSRHRADGRVGVGVLRWRRIGKLQHNVPRLCPQGVAHGPGESHAVDAPIVLKAVDSPLGRLTGVVDFEPILAVPPSLRATKGPRPPRCCTPWAA